MPRKTVRKKIPKVEKEPETNVPIIEVREDLPKGFREKKTLIIAALVCVIILLLPAVYFYNQYQKTQKLLKNPTLAAQEDAKELVSKVGKLMDLPKNEVPTTATVSDKTKLMGQAFFTKAENGDKVLIYSSIKKAILYRPSTNKLVEVAPVNFQDTNSQATITASSSASAPLKVLLLNGTETIGLTTKAESQLKGKISIAVVDRDNAKKRTYEKTVVVDIKGSNNNGANTLAKAIGGTVSSLPAGEATPLNADFVIILGSDFVK